jgi:peptidoglycan/xylan/chitin deacetylase (PgdA/CDA1 family)
VLGRKVEKYPSVLNELKNAGHIIGNHTYSHPKTWFKSKQSMLSEITRTDALIREITGSKPTLFRPPHGSLGFGLLRALKETRHKIVLWSGNPQDYLPQSDVSRLKKNIQNCCLPGNILLLHDGHKNSLNTYLALENILGELIESGARFEALPE